MPRVILICSGLSCSASGIHHSPIANKLGDQVGFGSYEVLPVYLCLRRVVHDNVIEADEFLFHSKKHFITNISHYYNHSGVALLGFSKVKKIK